MPVWLRHGLAWTAMFAFALSAKVHLPFVQLAAWTVMAANYAELMPVDQAVHRAVSGDELCGGCLYVRNAEHARQAGESALAQGLTAETPPALAPDMAPVAVALALPAAEPVRFPYPVDEYAVGRSGPPEPRPPRA